MKALFGGVIAVILLVIYAWLVWRAIAIVNCLSQADCKEYTAQNFNEGMVQALSIIGGLVSALVISELAATKPGEPPVARVLAANASTRAINTLRYVTVAYLLVWIGLGLWAFMVGLYHPKELPALTNLGQSWLGLAVAAGYAYFGIKPN